MIQLSTTDGVAFIVSALACGVIVGLMAVFVRVGRG